MDKDSVILKLAFRITELERRLNNMMRPGKVAEVFPDEHRLRMTDGSFTGPKIPWVESGGGIGTWTPPTVGQEMIMFSPMGRVSRSFALTGGFGSQGTPSSRGDEHVLTNTGSTRIDADGGAINMSTTLLTINADVKINGSILDHNGISINYQHEHIHPPSGTPYTGPPKG